MPFHPSEASVRLQTTPSYFALVKAANTIGYFALIYLTWRFATGHFDWKISYGCVLINACWLVLTRIKTDHLLQTYFDIFSRLELELPVVSGMILSIAAVLSPCHWLTKGLAVLEALCWIYIWIIYNRNKQRFKVQGYGPVPINTWVSPPASELAAGDLILTSGNIARDLHESVAHAEMVIQRADGKLGLFSCYMEKGAKIHTLESLTSSNYKGYYIALELRHPWTEDQKVRATSIAEEMVRKNEEWRDHENEKIGKFISRLPLPESTKDYLKKRFWASGYDWFGTFMGRVVPDRWTCIGACVELYHRMGVKTNFYGTGLLGFGTTLFDPIMPVRFLSDPAFVLIEKQQSGADQVAVNMKG